MIAKLATIPLTATARVVRALGARRVALLGVGAAAGALVTPVAGAELRRRLLDEIARRRSGNEASVEDRVRRRLADSPRTWHLAQPEVVAVSGESETGWQIILAGTAPDEAARNDLGDVALAVTGVVGIDNRTRVDAAEEVD